ncbi:MAG TPA: chaperone modulator CbpM [Candidatus Acidoferrales bacterium]|nr:chaperone modulator CbpM [Candidatus Acidoferrales bacterium]
MNRKYLRMREVMEICGVNRDFVLRLEKENLIFPVVQRRQKLYPLDQVDRVRVAHVLFSELGVNLEGIEVALHLRDQLISMRRRFNRVLRALAEDLRAQ